MSERYKVPEFNFQFQFEIKYDKTVKNRFYPSELREHFLEINSIKYPIFRLKRGGFDCLLCADSTSIMSIKDHLTSVKHISELQEQPALTRVMEFHDFWMNQERQLQMQQMYFGVKDKALKCTLCNLEVTYEDVATHVELPEHESMVLNVQETKQFTNSEISKQNLNGINSPKRTQKQSAKDSGTNKKQEHKTRKAVSNPNSSTLLERIPERYKNHLHFFQTSDTNGSITCRCCSLPIQSELIYLKLHLKTKNHVKKSGTPLVKFKFFCEICIKIYSSEDSWEKHMNSNEHLAVVNNLEKGRKGNLAEYECITCSLVIFGDKLSLIRHQQWNKKSKKKKELKLPQGVKQLFESSKHIEEVAGELIAEANGESQSQHREKMCCLALVNALSEIYPQCKVYPFGSRVIGLGGRESDLDIFVDVCNMYAGNKLQSPEEQFDIIMKVKKVLRKSKTIFTHINPVPTARTPIIQVFHVPSEIDCDVSFRHGLSVENTAFIRLCIDLQPVIQGVLLVLKQWCRMCDLNNFSSYALTMMAIFYFQTQGYLSSIKELKALNSKSTVIIDGWETIKYTASLATMKKPLKPCDLSVKDLLHDFFEFFACYDYDTMVMCPLLGESILKTCFNENGLTLPPEMEPYIKKMQSPDAELFRNRSPMCIQDPFDLSHNLTKACEKRFVPKWKGYCKLSAKHLSALH